MQSVLTRCQVRLQSSIYRNGSVTPSNTFTMNGNFTSTVGFSSGSLNNIDKVVIRGITDPAGIGFDDFSFTVPADVKITSGRVNGYLKWHRAERFAWSRCRAERKPVARWICRRNLLVDLHANALFNPHPQQFFIRDTAHEWLKQ
jgi:hypothetical protein